MKDKKAHERLDEASRQVISLQHSVDQLWQRISGAADTRRFASEAYLHSRLTDLRYEMSERLNRLEAMVTDLMSEELRRKHDV